jgi:hypothetical protein
VTIIVFILVRYAMLAGIAHSPELQRPLCLSRWDGDLQHLYQDLCGISYEDRTKLDEQSLLAYHLELSRIAQVVSEQVSALNRTVDFFETVDQLMNALLRV